MKEVIIFLNLLNLLISLLNLQGRENSKNFLARTKRGNKSCRKPFLPMPFWPGWKMFRGYGLPMNRKCNPERTPRARGFTVVELIITLAVLSTIMLIAFPSFQRMAINGNLRSAARDLIADFNNLKQRAMEENTQYVLTFSTGTNTYTCPGLPNGGKSPANIASGIRIASASFGGGNTVTFFTRGTLNLGGSVVLANGRGSTATITCNQAGRTYVQFIMQ